MPSIADYKYAILRMELFFICSACDMLDVDNLIEVDGLSINSGLSTSMFSKYFDGDEVDIYSIESHPI